MRVKLTQAGDTIVEVLVAIAVLSAVLAGAYATSGESLQGTQRAQERSEALNIAQQQVERLRAYSLSGSSLVFGGGDKCMTSASAITEALSPAGAVSDAPQDDDFSNHREACTSASAGIGGGDGVTYYVSIQRGVDGSGVEENRYTIRVRWPRLGGGQNEEVVLYYRAPVRFAMSQWVVS